MRALLVWELGDNFGHAGLLIRIGEELAAKGVEVYVALQDTLKAAPFLKNQNITLLAAPYGRIHTKPRPEGPPRPVLTYADDVALCGYDRADELASLLRAWHGLFDLVQPDILVADAAPTALIAAQGRPFIKVISGLGYGVPPLETPMPPFRYWEQHDPAVLLEREQQTLAIINQAQTLLGRARFAAFQDAIRTDAQFLTTFKEMDHYKNRTSGNYIGPFFINDRGLELTWQKDRPAKRIFAYLYPRRKTFAAAFDALRQLKEDTILIAPGLPQDVIDRCQSPYLRIVTAPVRTDLLTGDADLFISHGGGSTVVQFLLAGVPQLLIPSHIEQMIFANRMQEQTFGLFATAKMTPDQIRGQITTLLTDPSYRTAVQGFAARYADFTPEKQMAGYVAALLALVEK